MYFYVPVKLLIHESKIILTALSVLGSPLCIPMTSVYIIILESADRISCTIHFIFTVSFTYVLVHVLPISFSCWGWICLF